MKILIADDAHTFGGAQIAAVNLARYLGETFGHAVFFACSAQNQRLTERLRQTANLTVVDDGHVAMPFYILTHMLSLWRIAVIMQRLRAIRPDVLVVNMAGLEFGWLYIYAAKLLRLRTICWLHNPTRYDELVPKAGVRRLPGQVRDRCADWFATLIFDDLYTVSNAARMYLLKRLKRDTGIGILGNVVFPAPHDAARGDNPFATLCAGYAAARIAVVPGRVSFGDKGQDRLLACLPALAERSIALVFVGDGGDLAELQAACAGYRNVFFAGWQPAVDRYMVHADVVLLPSRFEAQPLIAMEAMMLNTPVVTSSIAPFLELAGDAYASDFTDGASLCDKIEQVCKIDKEQLMGEYQARMARFSGPVYRDLVARVFAGRGN